MDRTSKEFKTLEKSALILFPAIAAFISWSTSSIRESVGVANVALVLAIVTTCAALLRWEAGVLTSLVAASTLNFFHTEPIRSFRITSSSDLVMITLLTLIGFGVSFTTASRVRHVIQQFHSDTASDLLKINVQLLQEVSSQLPVINRRPGLSDSDDNLLLPETGAVMKFNDPRMQSVLLVTPHPGFGALYVSRRTMNAFADHVEAVIQ
jgi:K+-sensing histidine kinase KdpD